MPRRPRLHRDLGSAQHLDVFLVAAVSTVLLVRFYLRVTGYPQVGGETLHVAHMLWGGLLMLAALVLLLAFLGRGSRRWGAVVGGVGFGLFIDEIGKFVTRDNDYFYRPAVALIYVTFVVTYLAIRGIRRRWRPSREEYLVNALHELEEAVLHDMQADERDRALRYLKEIAGRDPLAAGIGDVIRHTTIAPARPPGPLRRLRVAALDAYRRLATRPAFATAIVVFFVAHLAVKLSAVLMLLLRPAGGGSVAAQLALLSPHAETFAVAEWLQLGSSLVSALLVAAGVALVRRARGSALRLFHRSILVSVFVTQVFMFYREQWLALVVLAFNVVVLLGLNYMIAHEADVARGARGEE